MNVIFFGTPQFVIPVAESLQKTFPLSAVVTTPDKTLGRNHEITPPAIKQWALNNNIRVFQPEKIDESFLGRLETLHPDLFVLASFGALLPEELLHLPKQGTINIHPSHLPQFRGPSPLQATILAGIEKSAITFLQMDGELDHGPILDQIPFHLTPHDTFASAVERAFRQAADHLPEVISRYMTGDIHPQAQHHAEATYCNRIRKQDGYIDLTKPISHIQFDRMVRAYYPWPKAFTTVLIQEKKKQLIFLPAQHIQLEGKKPVTIHTFYRGYPSLVEKLRPLYA